MFILFTLCLPGNVVLLDASFILANVKTLSPVASMMPGIGQVND